MDFAGKGKSFPIFVPADVTEALLLAGRRQPSNFPRARIIENIKAIANKKGFPYPGSINALLAAKREGKEAQKP